ncbi:sugar transferase [bacterium]|nr:sugar transferase [bacterium]
MKKVHKLRSLTRVFLFFGDLVWIPSAYFLSYWIRSKSALIFFQERMPLERMEIVNHRLWVLVVMHILLMYLHGFYDSLSYQKRFEIFTSTIRIVTFEILTLVAIYFFYQDILFPRSIFVLLWALLTMFTCIWHISWRRAFSEYLPQRNVILVGSGKSIRNVVREIQRLPSYGLNIVGVLKDSLESNNETELMGYPILGSRSNLIQVIQKHKVDEVILSSEGSWQEDLVGEISQLKHVPARICVLPNCYEILIGKINHLRLYDIPLIEMIKHPDISVTKRFTDLIGALLLILITFPLILFCICMIFVFMGRPIFYRQERAGKNQEPFIILKFRTMIRNAEETTGPILASKTDTRVTRLGKWLREYRLDELPQLFNILRGEMSFVGPRPERPYFVEKHLTDVKGYGERLKALPGLTGLAQVNGGYDTSPENKLKYDLAYIYNYSIWLDIKILIETAKVILTGRVNP